MGCGQGKTSAPQTSTKLNQNEALPVTLGITHPSKEHQNGTVTNEGHEDPESNAQMSVAAEEESVETQKDVPSAQLELAVVGPDCISPLANDASKTEQSDRPDATSAKTDPEPIASARHASAEQVADQTSLGRSGNDPLFPNAFSAQAVEATCSTSGTAAEPTKPLNATATDATPPASADAPRRKKICGCC
jgi:hypothetical protein